MFLEDSAQPLRREIVEIAINMLAGSTSFIAGARRISMMCFEAGLGDDPDLNPFVGIDSETDALPIDPEIRSLWSPTALDRLQPEIDRAEKWAQQVLSLHCERLIAKLKPTQL